MDDFIKEINDIKSNYNDFSWEEAEIKEIEDRCFEYSNRLNIAVDNLIKTIFETLRNGWNWIKKEG